MKQQPTTHTRHDGDRLQFGDSPADINKQLNYERWREATGDFLAKVCSAIARRTVPFVWTDPVSLPSGGDAIAYTDGESVFINSRFFHDAVGQCIKNRNMAAASQPIARIKGAALHEVSHILWTPRRHHRPTSDVFNLETSYPGIFRAFNYLEDPRIEMRFVTKYRPAAPYFISLVSEFIAPTDPTAGSGKRTVPTGMGEEVRDGMAFVLLYGRRYFPASVIRRAFDLHTEYINRHKVPVSVADFIRITDEYRDLRFPADADKAIELCKEMQAYLAAFENVNPLTNYGPTTPTGQHETQIRGNAERTSEQKEDSEAVQEYAEEHDPFSEEFDIADDDGIDGATGDGGEDGDEEGDSGGSTAGGSGAEEAAGSGDAADDGDGDGDFPLSSDGDSDSDSNGNGYSGNHTDSSPKPSLEEALKNAVKGSLAEIEEDAASSVKSIRHNISKSFRRALPDLTGAYNTDTTPVQKISSRKIQDAINAIRSEGEAVWDRGRPNGKLNAGLAMGARGTHFDVFDQWVDIGDDATSFEVVMLIDQSSSMAGFCMDSVSRGVWIVRDAMQALDIPVTVLGYDSKARLLFRSSDSAGKHTTIIGAHGNTDPEAALEWALAIFQASQASNKLLFSLTDGQWHSGVAIKSIMHEMKALGVHSCLFQQGQPNYKWNGTLSDYEIHGFSFDPVPPTKYFHDIVVQVGDSTKELPAAVAKAVAQISRELTSR